MILINRAFRWKDLRKVGIVYSSFNLSLRVCAFIVLLLIVPIVEVLIFLLLYIFLYSCLIYGLSSRKPSVLMVWLIYAPFEIIIIQVLLLVFDYFAISGLGAPGGIGIMAMTFHLAVTTFMFHNVCVVFTVRHNFIQNQDIRSRNLIHPLDNAIAHAAATNPQDNQNNSTTTTTFSPYIRCEEHVLLVAACFSGLYMFLHIMLICGLYSRKPSILMWWLAFAPFQIIALQAILLYINIIFLFLPNLESWVGILISLGHLVLTIFMFHNVCVVYSAQYSFKNNEDGQNRNYGNNISTAMRQPTTADPPYISMKA